MKQFCEYCVIDFETGLILVHGSKFKDFGERSEVTKDNLVVFYNNDFPCNVFCFMGSFKASMFSRDTIMCLCRFRRIKQRKCLILYYLHSNPSKKKSNQIWNVVLSAGRILGISGHAYKSIISSLVGFVNEFVAWHPAYKKEQFFDKLDGVICDW